MNNAAACLDVHNLQFAYPGQPPLFRDLTLTLSAGERVALTGPNGAGKTTLFNVLMGFRAPSSGWIRWFGEPAVNEGDFRRVRRQAGYLFQLADDMLFCATVADDVAFGPFNLGYRRDDVEQLVAESLALVGLEGYETKVTHHLSEGEKRLVSLAAVLAMKPAVLLLDEPTNGLDERARTRVINLLPALPQAMLIATHDRDFIAACTRRQIELTKA